MSLYYQSSQSNLKVIIVGKEEVGKSTFVQRFLTNKFSPIPKTQICDFFIKQVQHKNQTFRLEIWDTAGNSEYESLISQFYRNTQAVIFAFSIADPLSLEKLNFWYNDISNYFQGEIIKVVISTMSDLKNQQTNNKGEPIQLVSKKQIEDFLENKHIEYFETSSKSDTNVNETFNYIVEEIYKRENILEESGGGQSRSNNNNTNSISLGKTPPMEKKIESGCCS